MSRYRDRVNFILADKLKRYGIEISCSSNCWVKTLDGDIIHNDDRDDIVEHDRCEFYLGQPYLMEVKERLREMGYYVEVWSNAMVKDYRYEITYEGDKDFYMWSSNEWEYWECLAMGIEELLDELLGNNEDEK